jgi:hypothetical protein
MKNLFITGFLSVISLSLSAQSVFVKGKVKDDQNQPLEMANILVLNAQDSSMATYGFTNSDGEYRLQLKTNESYILKVSYFGLKPFEKAFKTGAAKDQSLAEVVLDTDINLLQQAEVVEEMPIVISGDTISYQADAFTNGEERKLENVLEKLPGFEVDEDGQITVEGKKVEKILVEGKEFFDGDTKVAVKNLPADAIDKVQVLRNYEEISPLKGLSSDDRIALNIKLKEGKKNLWFGDAEAKVGDPERYYAHGNAFYYSPKASFNLIGDINNIGKAAFTARDYFRFSGGFRNLTGRSGFQLNFAQDDLGIPLGQNNRADYGIGRFGAANFSYNPRKDLTLAGFVIANDAVSSSPYSTTRTYIGLDSLSPNGITETLNTENYQHSQAVLAKFSATYEPKKGVYVNYDAFFKISDQLSTSVLASDFGLFSNNLSTQEAQKPWSIQQSLELFFNNGENVFSFEAQHLRKQQDPLLALQAQNQPFGAPFTFVDTNMYRLLQTNLTNSESLEGRASYYWVLNANNHFEFNVGGNLSSQDYQNNIGEGVPGSSNDFSNPILQNTVDFTLIDGFAGIHYKTKMGKFTFRPGANWHYYQVRDIQAGDERIRDYQVLLPDALLKYDISNSRGIDLRYSMQAQFNDVNQIMNGLILRGYNSLFTGNDSLNYSRSHNVSLFYRDFNLFNFTTIFAGLNYSRTLDPINNAVRYIGLQQVFSPINAIGYNESITGFGSYSRKFKKFKTDFRVSYSYLTIENTVNDILNTNNTFTQNYQLGFGTNFKKWPNLDLNYNFRQNDYSGARSASVFTTHTPSAELSAVFLKSFVARVDYSYSNYGNPGSDTRTSFDFLNASVEYQKKGSPWLFSVEGLNILNTEFIREDALSANLISTTAYNVLPRYLLFGVRYDL